MVEPIALSLTSKETQSKIIGLFHQNGIKVGSNTIAGDSDYPYLYWDGRLLTQVRSWTSIPKVRHSVEEFMSHFNFQTIYEIW